MPKNRRKVDNMTVAQKVRTVALEASERTEFFLELRRWDGWYGSGIFLKSSGRRWEVIIDRLKKARLHGNHKVTL